MVWVVCLGANSKFAVYLKGTQNIKRKNEGVRRKRMRGEKKEMTLKAERSSGGGLGWSRVDKQKRKRMKSICVHI